MLRSVLNCKYELPGNGLFAEPIGPALLYPFIPSR